MLNSQMCIYIQLQLLYVQSSPSTHIIKYIFGVKDSNHHQIYKPNSVYSLHMDEFCPTVFHTLLSSKAHQNNSLPKWRINADGWMRPNIQYFQIMHVVIVSVILLDLLPSFICIQSLHSVCSWLLLSLWQRRRVR